MAEAMGKQLLTEIERVGFDELLHSVRREHNLVPSHFNLKSLDDLVDTINAGSPGPQSSNAAPILEVVSLESGGGKTHILYHLTALATVQTQYGGRESCVSIIDADGTFSVPRLAQQLRHVIEACSDTDNQDEVTKVISSDLQHVHISRPQSMRSLIATITNLPDYFLNTKHSSLDRNLAFIAIDSATAFYWQSRAEEEDVKFAASMAEADTLPREQPMTYTHLSEAVKLASVALHCPIIFTACHLGQIPTPVGTMPRVLRSNLPMPFSQLATLRLIVRRLPVPKFPYGVSMVEALQGRSDRENAVNLGRFECVVNEVGLDPPTLQNLRAVRTCCHFTITGVGLTMKIEDDDVNETDETKV